MESSKLQPEWNKRDKLALLNLQKVFSVVGFFLSIVECTNLFLTYKKEANTLFLNFGIVTILVILLNILTLVWALRQTDRVNKDDENEQSTDTPFTQVVLFLALYINTLFATDLTNQYAAGHDTKQIQALAIFLTEKQGWIDFISISNLVVGVFTVFCAYSLAPSALTHRLMVYILIIFSLDLSFNQIGNQKNLEQVFTNASQKYNEWSLSIIFGVAVANIVFLFLTYFANTRKLRIAYMILGAFFLVAVAVQIPATGRLLKDYRELSESYTGNCVPELGKINVEQVESQGCPNKYLYASRAQCPQSPSGCFISPNDCPTKNNLFQVWETTLVTDPIQTNVLGCINTQCCGVLVNQYTRVLLTQAQYSLCFLFLSFYLAVFTFQLSSMDKGDQNVHPKLFVAFTFFFVLVFIIGIFLVNWPSNAYLQRQGIVTGQLETGKTSVIHIQQNEQLDHYLKDGCQVFKEFQLKQTATKSAISNAADYSAVTSLGDLETMIKTDPNNNLCGTGTCDGYMVLLRTPQISTSPKCDSKIEYTVQGSGKNDVRVLAASTVSTLLPVKSGSKYNFFGVVGTQAKIEEIFQGNLNVCGYVKTCATITAGATHDNQFVVRVLKVDLSTFGFKLGKNQVTQTTTTTTSTMELGHLRKKVTHSTPTEEAVHTRKLLATKQEQHKAAATLKALVPANSAVMQIVVHNVENDKPLEGATLKVYSNAPNFNDNCDTTAVTVPPDYEDNTGKDGLARVELYFATAAAQTYSVYASKDGYNTNCRKFALTKAQATNVVDLGLGKELKTGQTRVHLMWDTFKGVKSATDVQPFDLDLWATFGQYAVGGTVAQFDCHVGITDHNCGGVKYHGDSQTKTNGKTSEAITFETIGSFNYLIFFNRYYSKLPASPAATKWVTDVTSFEPVLKYYSSESNLPENTVTLATLVGTLAADLNKNQKFNVLAYCIKASGDAPTEKVEAVATANTVWKKPLYNDYDTNYLPNSQSSRGSGAALKTVC